MQHFCAVGVRRLKGRKSNFCKWFKWEKDSYPTPSRWELQGGTRTSICAVIKHVCPTDQATASTDPFRKMGFYYSGIKEIYIYIFFLLHVCKRLSALQEIRSRPTAVRCRKHPRGAQIIFQANMSRFDRRSITLRVALPRVHQSAAAEQHPSAAWRENWGAK